MEHAIYILEKYAELAPGEPNPYDSYGEILQREGRLEEAVRKYKESLKINPGFWPARIHLASAYQDMGRFRKAKALLKAMLKDTTFVQQKRNTESRLAWHEIVVGDIAGAEKIWQRIVDENPKDASAIFSLLSLRPDYEPYRQQFVRFVDEELNGTQDNVSFDYLFPMLFMALRYNLAIDKVEQALDKAVAVRKDPIFEQAAAAYKIIIDFQKGRSSEKTALVFTRPNNAQAFRFAGPVSWNEYWRFYFSGLKTAQQEGMNIKQWVMGFQDFALESQNVNFQLESEIARAAAEFYSGDSVAAKGMLTSIGIPCEDDWRFLGPFKMTRGFNEKFWPEKKKVEEWLSREKYSKALLQQRDDLFDGYIDLKQIGDASFNDAMYALLRINSPTFQDAQLRIGMSGKLKAWLNDESVMIKNIRTKAIIDNFIATVRLRPGANWLLLLVNNATGELGFYCRLTGKNGDAIERVDFNAPTVFAESELQNGVKEGA